MRPPTSLTGGGRRRTRRGIRDTALLTVLIAGLVAGVMLGRAAHARGHSNTADGFAAIPLLATTAGEPVGAPVDGITAEPVERIAFHVHAHLQIYVDGQPRAIPEGVGIVPPYQIQQDVDGPFIAGGRGFYWLHTHDRTGVIHIESPVPRVYTLGEFFDIWGQPLGCDQVGPFHGPVSVLVNGTHVTGDPAAVPLHAHEVIQLAVGPPVAFRPHSFPPGL